MLRELTCDQSTSGTSSYREITLDMREVCLEKSRDGYYHLDLGDTPGQIEIETTRGSDTTTEFYDKTKYLLDEAVKIKCENGEDVTFKVMYYE